MEIKKVYKEDVPAVCLIGKVYTEADRSPAGYGHKWGEWFKNQWFFTLEKCEVHPAFGGDYVGAMRFINGTFEYWIGILTAPKTIPPEGFVSVEIDAGTLATCWIYGREDNGEIYGMDAHDACMKNFEANGWQIAPDAWYYGRYNCPRFTTPDEQGNVILDYCVYLASQ